MDDDVYTELLAASARAQSEVTEKIDELDIDELNIEGEHGM